MRALRFVSQLGFELAPETEAQMHEAAPGLAHVSAERIGGGIKADGQGELSKLLLGRAPERALRLARDTGVLVRVIPEFESAIGYPLGTERQPLPLEEHMFAVVQRAADADDPLEVRLACLLHDLGKPAADATPELDHARAGAAVADRVLRRLRYPTRVRQHVVRIVAAHGFHLDGALEPRDARRFLADHGDELALDLIEHKAADLAAKRVAPGELDQLARLRELIEQERSQPHRLGDLAVDGDDLKAIGLQEGPELGRILRTLLDEVVDDPARNEPAWLLDRGAGARVNAAAVREAYEAVVAEAGPGVTVVAATKYVPFEEMGVLADAGVAVVGENRAQDLQRKHERYGERFRWHFIGALQSNKARIANELCELVHAVDTDSSARRLTVPWLLEVNLAGEASKSGVGEEEIAVYRERYPLLAGLMTMPPFADDPEASRPTLPSARAAGARARARAALDGHLAGLAGGRRGGRHPDPHRQHAVSEC